MALSRLPILSGYILILVLTVAIGYAYYNEEHTLSLMDEKNCSANELRREETAMEWTDMERYRYHRQRLHIDSTLCEFGRIFISEAADIDSLRILLEDKEKKLLQLTEIYRCQKSLGDEMANKLPVIARQSAKEEPKKPKRKGFLGIFGKRKNQSPLPLQPCCTASTAVSWLSARRRTKNLKHRLIVCHNKTEFLISACRI